MSAAAIALALLVAAALVLRLGDAWSRGVAASAQFAAALLGAVACALSGRRLVVRRGWRLAQALGGRRCDAAPWCLAGASLVCAALGNAMPEGVAGVWWSLQYPFLWLGLLALAAPSVSTSAAGGQGELEGKRPLARLLIDRLIIVLAVLVVFWKTLWEQGFAHGLAEAPLGAKSLAFFFPAAPVGHLFCGLMLLSVPRHVGARALLALQTALLLLIVTDTAYALRLSSGTYHAGEFLDAGWVAAWLALGVAAAEHAASASQPEAQAHPNEERIHPAPARRGWEAEERAMPVWLPYAAALGACAVLILHENRGGSGALSRLMPVLGLVVAIIARQMMTLSDNVRLSQSLRRANRDLERNVSDRTRHLETLHGITSTLNSSLDDRAILHAILDGLIPAVGADGGGVWLREPRRWGASRAASRIRYDSAPEDSGGPSTCTGHHASGSGTCACNGHREHEAEGAEWAAEWSPAYTRGLDDDAPAAIALRDQAIIAAITERRASVLPSPTSRSMSARALPDDRTLILVPIRWHGLLLGAVGLLKRGGEFGYGDRALAESVALEAGTALQNARMFQEASRRADRDPVTELLNHRAMQQALHCRVLKARVGGEGLAVVMMDLNNFKFFNDTYGHGAGDDVLRAVARALGTACRADDLVGRHGGDEFLALLPGANASSAREACARIASEMDRHHFEAGPDSRVPISLSFGCAVFPGDGATPRELATRAEERLQESKRGGSNSFLWSLPQWSAEVDKTRSALARRRRAGEAGEEAASTSGAPQPFPSAFGGTFDVLDALVTAIDNKDRYTRRHSEEVTQLALMTARELGISPELLRAVRIAGLLHDVGKIAVPDSILRHPGRLGEEEARIMRQHPVFGALIVRDVAHEEPVVAGVRHHHERWDGGGYPDGLAGEAIPWMGRLLAVGDNFSALTTDRPYRKALGPWEALRVIEDGSGTQFDPAFVAAFTRALRREMSRAGVLPQEAPAMGAPGF